MKNKNKLSEESYLYRNLPTSNQEQQNTKNNYSFSSNQSIIQQIFQFYTKQSYALGVNATFDRQQQECNQLNLAKFFHFCRDFNINFLNKQELQDLFKKCSNHGQNINFQQFEQLFSLLAFKRGIDLCKFYKELGFDVWLKNNKKMKLLGKPFYMKDDRQRFQKEELHYKFELFHPDIKDQNLIKEILKQRKVKSEQNMNFQKERKIQQKMQQELKFKNGTELIEKYPDKIELIQQIQRRRVTQHICNFKPLTKLSYSLDISKQENKQEKTSIITWKDLDAIIPDTDLILSLIEPKTELDKYLNQYQIYNNLPKNLDHTFLQNSSKLSQNTRFRSDSNPNYYKDKNSILTERLIKPKYNYQELPPKKSIQFYHLQEQPSNLPYLSNVKSQIDKSPQQERWNIQMFKRANEIQQLEGLKQQYLIQQNINNQLK
ncbi:unnamed protein product [Paramecium sonneborni]|uniref:Uncharacterized protein n=1 Tax=Paramecium sonneborni TaxID=65129 RepID=A0A8S1NAV1_9CILI|nr:unnamed protein product [Paramecium sonneborni]